MKTEEYFKQFEKEIRTVYAVAEEAKKQGYDPVSKVEIPLARSMAEKVVGLISTIYPQLTGVGIEKRILNLEKQWGKLNVAIAFKISEEIAKQKYCKFSNLLEAIDAGIRIGFAYITLGVVSSPIEGYTKLELGKTKEGKEYFKAYFSGPIRSAGTTASCVVLMLIDYLREIFGYAKYDPSEEEIKRYYIENHDYHERITNLQYMPTEEEALFLASNLPIQIEGDPTEKREVSNYKNLERVDTNFIRGGMCLIFSEGLAQKAKKGLRLLDGVKEKGFQSSGWDFLRDYVKLHDKRDLGKTDSSPTYIKDLVAGRPVFGHPGRSGAFRFRYGRGRNSGFSASCVHPATMAITDGFLATGTQLKIEKPTKGTAVASCTTIDGPIVLLKDGSVKKLRTAAEAKKLYPQTKEIIYLGDILFPFSDLANRNAELIKPGYVEEWWELDLIERDGDFAKTINSREINFEKAVEISKIYNIPLHPSYIFYWTQISKVELNGLLEWLKNTKADGKLILPYSKSEKEKYALGKRALELLGVEHDATIEHIVIEKETSKALLANLGINPLVLDSEQILKNYIDMKEYDFEGPILDIINSKSKFKIKDKAGEFIGARMGRPEKAKLRKLIGSPNVLFPVGKEGGRLRSIQEACSVGKVWSSFPLFYCPACKKDTVYNKCEDCGTSSLKMYYCAECKLKNLSPCKKHEKIFDYSSFPLDIKHYFENAKQKIGMSNNNIPALIKGVRGMSSSGKQIEHLSKGILRAKHNLQVNKDGTIRFDATELPLISFKPKEVSVSIEKLKQIGYTTDIHGKALVDENQILELMPHDIILPSSSESQDERADRVFINVANFLDDLLVGLYGLKPFYKLKSKEDLVGQLGVCMAPHNCAGVICRFVGFSNTLGLLASPYMHAAIRRDCFDYNTFIPIKKGKYWKNVKIGELVENLNPCEVVDLHGTKEKKVEGFKTISFNKSLKEYKINNFTKHTPQNMFEIKTALGKSIRVTENHKFLINGKEKKAKDLKIGNKLLLPRKINIPSLDIKEINLLDFLDDEDLMVRGVNPILKEVDVKSVAEELKISKKQFGNFLRRDSYPVEFIRKLKKNILEEIYKKARLAVKRDNVEIPITVKLTNELLEVIGLYIAEGYSRRVGSLKGLNQVYISSNDIKIRSFVERVMKKSFGLVKSENKKDRVTFSSKILYLFFTKILEAGSIAKEKRIPYMFLNLPLERLDCVLRGYFEGDGSVSSSDVRVSCDTVSEGLLVDIEFCLARYGIFAKRYFYEKEPGLQLKNFYIRKNRNIPLFKITKLIIGSDFIPAFERIGFLSFKKKEILKKFSKRNPYGMKIDYDSNFIQDPIISITFIGKKESYCLNVNTKSHLVVGNSIVSKQCDGDEAAVMLLGDVLINFSRKFLPEHRGGTQDAPLVLNGKIDAGEVDDQILDLEFLEKNYPIELYQLAEQKKHSSFVKNVLTVEKVLKEGKDPFVGIGFSHDTDDINLGVVCSVYKTLPSMSEKVSHQMGLVEKIRAADTADTARLIIEKHFIRDTRGNLRGFSMQTFRCVACNEIMRRPPLNGICNKCKGKIIFTIHEGGIKKYLEATIDLAEKYGISSYLKQQIQITKRQIDSIFGREPEKQEKLEAWF